MTRTDGSETSEFLMSRIASAHACYVTQTLALTQCVLVSRAVPSQVQLVAAHRALKLKAAENKRISEIAKRVVQERTEVEQFFVEALREVRAEISTRRAEYVGPLRTIGIPVTCLIRLAPSYATPFQIPSVPICCFGYMPFVQSRAPPTHII